MGCCGQPDAPPGEWVVTWQDGTSDTFVSQQEARVEATRRGRYKSIVAKK